MISDKKRPSILDLLNNANNMCVCVCVLEKDTMRRILGNFNFRAMMLQERGSVRKGLSGEHSLPHFISFL